MHLIPVELYYPLLAVFMWLFALVLIPKDKLKTLFWYGLVWGFLAGKLMGFVCGAWLNLYAYQLVEPFKFLGGSLWLSFAWIPAIMIYLYYLPMNELKYTFPLYLLAFALASAGIDEVFHAAGLLNYNFWNPFFRFIIAIFWFWGVKVHYNLTSKAFQNREK